MRFTLCLAVLAGVASMTGCASAVAIHPFYTSTDLVSDLPLEGTWSGDDQVWQIQKSDDGYVVTTQNETFNVHLLRLKDSEFVDVASKSDPEIGVAGHLIGKIAMAEGKLYVSPINETWLKQMMDAGRRPNPPWARPANRAHRAYARSAAVYPAACVRPRRLGRRR